MYTNGYITYYKTDSTAYGKDFDFEKILATHQLHSEWGNIVLKINEKGFEAPTRGEEVGNNTPIVPIKSAEKGTLTPNEWKIYEYITKIFLATLSQNAYVSEKEITFQIDQELFKLKTSKIETKGFLNILPWLNNVKESELGRSFKVGEEYFIDTKKIADGKDEALAHMTEYELITAMKNYEIGGHFKIPHYIKTMIENGYVTVDKKNNRALVPTNLGVGLIKAFRYGFYLA